MPSKLDINSLGIHSLLPGAKLHRLPVLHLLYQFIEIYCPPFSISSNFRMNWMVHAIQYASSLVVWNWLVHAIQYGIRAKRSQVQDPAKHTINKNNCMFD